MKNKTLYVTALEWFNKAGWSLVYNPITTNEQGEKEIIIDLYLNGKLMKNKTIKMDKNFATVLQDSIIVLHDFFNKPTTPKKGH